MHCFCECRPSLTTLIHELQHSNKAMICTYKIKRKKEYEFSKTTPLLKSHYSFQEIVVKAKEIFKDEFIEKQFIAQLGYFKGINYDEEVTLLIPNQPSEEEVKSILTEISLSGLED